VAVPLRKSRPAVLMVGTALLPLKRAPTSMLLACVVVRLKLIGDAVVELTAMVEPSAALW
jgi:hypothetical protein